MSKKNRKNRKSKLGMAPGSLVFTGEQKMLEVEITAIYYSQNDYFEEKIIQLDELKKISETHQGVVWINIDGVHDENEIEKIGDYFNLHKLTIEDILSIGQRPKLDEYEDYIHLVLKMPIIENQLIVENEQISFILKNNILLTFQEKTGDVFNDVRKRIKEGKGYVRNKESDYLLYILMDALVDYYFYILDLFHDKIEVIEDILLNNKSEKTLYNLHNLRKQNIVLRRSIYPLREVINKFEKINEPFLKQENKIFIKDLYDHTIQAIDLVDSFRDSSASLLDLYMHNVSNKMNEIMKVLTIMSSIFIPLTFIAGIYGMNFKTMPELEFSYSYYIVLSVMLMISIAMIFYFKRKRWL
jgi:magnesium transporter